MMNPVSPLTGTTAVTLLQSFPASTLIELWEKQYQIDIREELGGAEVIQLFECQDTHLKFFWPLNVAGSAALYEKLQQFSWYYSAEKPEYDHALKALQGCRRILEVGCGRGAFVALGRQHGLDIRGIEINSKAVAAAQSQGLPVIAADLHDVAATEAGTYDAVCSFQVLEHVSDPRSFLGDSIALLRPGGLLIQCVPNADSFLANIFEILDMPPHHMLRWSAAAFASLSKIFPVDLVSATSERLALAHVRPYATAKWHRYASRFPALKWALNRGTRAVAILSLSLGLRRWASGHSIYAVLKKRSTPQGA